MSLYEREPRVGEGVVLNRNLTAERQGTGESLSLERGTQFNITRVYSNRVMVRTVERFRERRDAWTHITRARSFTIAKEDLDYDSSVGTVTPPRRLGQKPHDTDDVIYVSIDDPGIQWLFEDMGRYATDQGWCPQYDALCARLGIPGRPRPFNVNRTVNNINLTTTVQARSQAEANRLVDVALGLANASETTPSESETIAA